ncbi:inositol monophosphatase family protein [Plantactinospora sp. GCM10030261]|uniref:inositol monophosphatase family protein n=1 Tax=Plantactinospora sp. GCM10030261 TaxID=3273420 RepID=UPI003617F3DE
MEDDPSLGRRAALAGATVGMAHFAALARLRHETKPDGSVVTEADRAVESAIRAVLGEARPEDAILGEETGQTGTANRRWIIDPIDGTALFVTGDDRWLVLLALESAGDITVGVAVVPARREIWWAERGGGAYRAEFDGPAIGRPHRLALPADPTTTLAGSRFGVVPSEPHLTPADRELIAPLTAVLRPTPWRTHAALLVAAGDLDLAVQTRGQLWDFAATSLIVTEAGGRVTGLDGRPAPAPGPTLFTRDPALHDAALRTAGVLRR